MSDTYNLLLKIQADAEEIRKANAEMKEMQNIFNSTRERIMEGFKKDEKNCAQVFLILQ